MRKKRTQGKEFVKVVLFFSKIGGVVLFFFVKWERLREINEVGGGGEVFNEHCQRLSLRTKSLVIF